MRGSQCDLYSSNYIYIYLIEVAVFGGASNNWCNLYSGKFANLYMFKNTCLLLLLLVSKKGTDSILDCHGSLPERT